MAVLVKDLLTTDPVDLGLAQVSADSAAATRGRASRYGVTIASARVEPSAVTLRIDIHDVGSPSRAAASFATRLAIAPRTSTDVVVDYDWRDHAGFRVGGVSLPPDDLWTGPLDRPGPYAVRATLLDPDGRRLDAVTVYQRLMP
jgi:hypothetical protein